MSGVLQRAEVVDVLFRDEQCLVLTRRRCILLSEVAAAAFAYLDRPRTGDELAAHLRRSFGRAPDGAFEELVAALVEADLIIRER